MIADHFLGPYSGSVSVTLRRRDNGNLVGTYSSVPVGSSLMVRTIDFGALADGDYNLESDYPPGVWAVRVTGGVASIYDDWSEVNFLPSSNGSGQYTITVTVLTGVTPIGGAFVTVQRSGSNLTWGYTSSNGQITFSLDAGSYTLSSTAFGFESVTGQALTVSANGSASISMTVLPSSPAASVPVIGDDVMTFADLVYRLLTRRGLDGTPRELNQLRVAVTDAYRDLSNHHKWKHYERRYLFRTEAKVDLVATYDHTGGAHERLLTLTSGTAHDTFDLGDILYQSEVYTVERVVSPTEVILTADRNPGRDWTGGCSWRRSTYSLPANIRQLNEIIREGSGQRLTNLSSADASSSERFLKTAGSPSRYMIRSSDNYSGVTDIELFPPPSEEHSYSVSMSIRPNVLKVFEDKDNDAVGSQGSTTITSASGIFTQRHVGCVIRISPNSDYPIGLTQFDEEQGLPVYTFQTVIKRVINSTTIEVLDSLPIELTGNGFTISSIVDINIDVMLSFLESLSWLRFCHNFDVKQIDIAKKVMVDELRAAMEADNKVNFDIEGAMGSPGRGRLKYFAIYEGMN